MTGRDCKDCKHCESVRGFMCICITGFMEMKVNTRKPNLKSFEKETARSHAKVCEFYERKEDE